MKKCLCNSDDILIFACSGGSNCGQIANQVAINLTKEGMGELSCLAGVSAYIGEIIEAAKSAHKIIAIDGCSDACAKETLKKNGLLVKYHIDITTEGIVKNRDFKLSQQDIFFITKRVKQKLKEGG